jgi:hypothetical protein
MTFGSILINFYLFQIVNNNSGELCSHYPSKIIIMEYLADGGKLHEK